MESVIYMAEKANAGADIAKVLGLTRKNEDGFFTGTFNDKRVVVAWASGHYVTLKEPADIDEKYAKWNLEDLPITFDLKKGLKVIKGREGAFNKLVPYLQGADLIVNCGDAGREGELIQRWIYKMAGASDKPVKRLWTSSLTSQAISEANKNLLDADKFNDLYASGEARAYMDAFLGFNYSRALSLIKSDGVTIAYGRCQTPLLRAIVERDMEIENFVPVPFSYIKVDINAQPEFTAVLLDETKKERREFSDPLDAAVVLSDFTDEYVVREVKAEKKKENPPKPYSTLKIQKEMSKRYGFSAEKTLELLQELYDTHKMISYPRTDAEYLTTDMKEDVKDILSALSFPPYDKYVRAAGTNDMPARYFNDGKIEDHHAIVPEKNSDIKGKYEKLSDDQRKVFDAVARRFIALFLPPHIYEKQEVLLSQEGHYFLAKGACDIDAGFKALYAADKDEAAEEKEDSKKLPDLGEGELLSGVADIVEDKTKPKARYTESSLLTLMDINGIGTGATRANLIKELTSPKGKNKQLYVEKKKNSFYSTELGRAVIGVVPKYMSSLDFLGEMDGKIRAIADGKLDRDSFLKGLLSELDDNISLLKATGKESALTSAKPEKKESAFLCPVCGELLFEYEKGYGCSGYASKSCSFFLHKTKGKRKIPDLEIMKLLTVGKTGVIKGFKAKSGKSFNSSLVLTDEGKVVYDFQIK